MLNEIIRATVKFKKTRKFIKSFSRKHFSVVCSQNPNLGFAVTHRLLMQVFKSVDNKKRLFNTICIQTCAGCNYSCPFCPANKPGLNLYGGAVKQAKMELGLYKSIVCQLSELNFKGRITLAAMDEPLIDDRIVDLISFIRKKCPLSFIFIQTNGSLLDRKLTIELVKAGINEIYLNDYTIDNTISNRLSGILSDKKYKRYLTFEKREVSERLTNRAGNVDLYGRIKEPIKLPCVKPFRQMFIAYNGKVILCCQDWESTQIMGDVSKDRLYDIWLNENYSKIRRMLADFRRDGNPLCAQCDSSGLW